MGFFKSIFGKKSRVEPVADQGLAPAGPGAALHKRANQLRWGWEQPEARALTHEILNLAAPRFGNAKIKEVPDDENIDLRGSYDGAPVRFAVWMSFGTFWAVEMLCSTALDGFSMERDHEKIPAVEDRDDPFAKNDARRIFVAKGIFFEGDDEDLAERLAIWGGLPPDMQTRILRDMEELDINSIRIHSDGVYIHQSPGLRDLPDAGGYMEACALLMADLKNLAPQTRTPSSVGAVESTVEVGRECTCSYCHSIFLLTLSRSHCPNCGAPPSA